MLYVTMASCIASILGSLAIIGVYLSNEKKHSRTLLLRRLYTLATVFFPVSSFLWTDCIGLYVYATTCQKTWIHPWWKLSIKFHLLCWLLPLLTIIAILIFRIGFSKQGLWCWVSVILKNGVKKLRSSFFLAKRSKAEKEENVFKMWQGVEWVSYLFLLGIYFWSYLVLRKAQIKEEKFRLQKQIKDNNKTKSFTKTQHVENNRSLRIDASKTNEDKATKLLRPPQNSDSEDENEKHDSMASTNFSSNSTYQTHVKEENRKLKSLLKRLLFIPLIFILIRMPGSLRNLLLIFHSKFRHTTFSKILEHLQLIFDPAQGWFGTYNIIFFKSSCFFSLFLLLAITYFLHLLQQNNNNNNNNNNDNNNNDN
ncbi:AB-hydrolase associated lipase region containing protein [Reticulomyxa filosa]|uniref:AB-hydrolase associated lipase region containing protein n=1 Tax=Reticulomyxa filosa TaxID=46433 RepID=X6MDY7_RETFI|nr:AB-hydrolase associated lipase region containing protein [Reticulomyxa filosa]|eukprot:ETO11255.1 AB-hydrolase associated lipase region containing protein [Reticulomyxa filosa]